jgi:RimJ/RimL family protein N-acetyltransferase
MEKFPFQPELERPAALAAPSSTRGLHAATTVKTSDWREALPLLTGDLVTLRELCAEDAPVLLAMLSTEEVSRFISPPPTTVDGFEQFIAWTHSQREAGAFVCYGIVPAGMTRAVGIFQVRALASDFSLAEWGFVMGSAYWGTGAFIESARLVLDFTFSAIGSHRVEARAAVANGRGNGALRKLGAVAEGVLRRSFFRDGVYHDQVLWSVLADDWRVQRSVGRVMVH